MIKPYPKPTYSELSLNDQNGKGVFEALHPNKMVGKIEFYVNWGNVLKNLNKCELAKQKHNKALEIDDGWIINKIDQITNC